jgi:hypothetical protein
MLKKIKEIMDSGFWIIIQNSKFKIADGEAKG